MDYEAQRVFLSQQRNRLLIPATGCLLLLIEAVREPAPHWARLAGVALALGLLWAASYLPNYLGLDAAAIRRPRWVAKARCFGLLLAAIMLAASHAWLAFLAVGAAALLHFSLFGLLRKGVPFDLRDPEPKRVHALAGVYAVADLGWIWLAQREGVSTLLLAELLAVFSFLAVVIEKPKSLVWNILAGALPAGIIARWLAPSVPKATLLALCAGVFLWVAGATYLYARALRQNLANFSQLVADLQAFTGEARESVVSGLAETVPRLGEDWHRSNPQGQAAVREWYSRNARLYLYANGQHHLLYKHIVYTLGLLRTAQGRVLDFGGGPGNFSLALARAGFDTTYLDVPGDAADYLRWRAARERIAVKVEHDLDALAGPYDVIFALDVIEHLVDLKPVIARWKLLLPVGGRLLATYYDGPNSSAPMHIDPGYDAKAYLLTQGFRDVKPRLVGPFSAELLRKPHFMILEKVS